jgi:hypothetical protein
MTALDLLRFAIGRPQVNAPVIEASLQVLFCSVSADSSACGKKRPAVAGKLSTPAPLDKHAVIDNCVKGTLGNRAF